MIYSSSLVTITIKIDKRQIQNITHTLVQCYHKMYNQVKRISQNSKAMRRGRNTISLSNIASEELELQFNEGKSIFVDFQPLLKSSSNLKFDEEAFKESYLKCIELLNQKNEAATKSAAATLSHLCMQLKYASTSIISIPFDMIQGAVFHCWKLKNEQHRLNPTQQSKMQILHFLRQYLQILTRFYSKSIRSKSMSSLYLILAKEEFDNNELKMALNYCDVSCNYIYGPRNYVHMIKVHFLKSKVYHLMKNVDKELEEIKKCEKNLRKLLSPNLNDGAMNEFGKQIMLQLDLRKEEIKKETAKPAEKSKMHDQQQKNSIAGSGSAIQYKKRSISLHKLKKSQDQIKKTFNSSTEKGKASASMHIAIKHKSQSKSKLTANRQLLRLDINLPSKNQSKLRKRPLKITSLKEDVDYTQLLQSQTLKLLQDTGMKHSHEDMLLRRPNSTAVKKVQKLKEIKKQIEMYIQKQEIKQQKQMEIISEKEEQIPQLQHHHTGINKKQKYDELIKQIIRPFQQAILEKYINKISFFNEQSHQQNTEIAQEDQVPVNQEKEQPLNHFVIKEKPAPQDIVERNILFASHYTYLPEEQLCLGFGIITLISASVQVDRVQNKNREISYQQFQLILKCRVHEIGYCECKLQFALPTSLHQKETTIDKVLLDLNKSHQDSSKKKGQSKDDLQPLLKQQILLFIAKNLTIQRRINGYRLTQKNPLLKASKIQRYFLHRLAKYQLYELNQYTSDRLSNQLNNQLNNSSPSPSPSPTQAIQAENITSFWTMQNKKDLTRLIKQVQENQRTPPRYSLYDCHSKFECSKFTLRECSKVTDFFQNDGRKLQPQQSTIMINQTPPLMNMPVQIVAPDEFNEKVNNFFEQKSSTTRHQFYYCMKFLLIKPPCKAKSQTLNNFYDSISVSYLYNLMSKHQVMIKMTCFKVKKMFKRIDQLFFKFEFQLKEERIKMMKFISTHHDIMLILKENSHAFSKHPGLGPSNGISFDKHSLFALLKLISKCIFLKKDFMYFSIGFQTHSSIFSFINKFRLEGKAILTQHFLSPCLKFINILCQKSIKIHILNTKYYSVMTVIKIEKANTFSIMMYIPKISRTYSFTLTKSILTYLTQQQLNTVFNGSPLTQNLADIMFQNCSGANQREMQRSFWNQIIKLMQFQILQCKEKCHLIVKIGDYNAFVKDCSLSEYFQISKKILHLQMSLQKKEKQVIQFSPQISYNSNSKYKYKAKKQSIDTPSCSLPLKANEIFQLIKNISQSDMQKYILYISLTNVYNIPTSQESHCDNQKINFSFYLSDVIELIKENHKNMGSSSGSSDCFRYAVLLRTFTSIKYKLINQLKKIEIEEVFSSAKSFQIQKAIKMRLNMQFKSNKQHPCSLNSEKQYNRYQKNIFLVNKNIISLRNSLISSIFYDSEGKSMQFFISSNETLLTKQHIMPISQSPFPHLQFYNTDIFLKANARILKYFKNKLLLVN